MTSTTDSQAFLGAACDLLAGSPVAHSVILANAADRRRAGVWTTMVCKGVVVAAWWYAASPAAGITGRRVG